MTGKRPRLYPSHQHQWTDADSIKGRHPLASCIVCGLTVPANLANLDGKPADVPVTDQGVAT